MRAGQGASCIRFCVLTVIVTAACLAIPLPGDRVEYGKLLTHNILFAPILG
jgi:hypothetical protein